MVAVQGPEEVPSRRLAGGHPNTNNTPINRGYYVQSGGQLPDTDLTFSPYYNPHMKPPGHPPL